MILIAPESIIHSQWMLCIVGTESDKFTPADRGPFPFQARKANIYNFFE